MITYQARSYDQNSQDNANDGTQRVKEIPLDTTAEYYSAECSVFRHVHHTGIFTN